MLGHKLWQRLSADFAALPAVRSADSLTKRFFPAACLLTAVDAEDESSVCKVLASVQPEVIVNCIGLVKQLNDSKSAIQNITINALFPHRLSALCRQAGIRLIHISTDCVFSGAKGNYLESDAADADDAYGKAKALGEVEGAGCLTIRTSLVGRQLRNNYGLLEWFLSQNSKSVYGYTNARFSGLTTVALSDVLAQLIEHHEGLSGIWHISSAPISKYELLRRFRDTFNLDVEIVPSGNIRYNRTLDSSRFKATTGITLPSWDQMIEELAADPTPYARLAELTEGDLTADASATGNLTKSLHQQYLSRLTNAH